MINKVKVCLTSCHTLPQLCAVRVIPLGRSALRPLKLATLRFADSCQWLWNFVLLCDDPTRHCTFPAEHGRSINGSSNEQDVLALRMTVYHWFTPSSQFVNVLNKRKKISPGNIDSYHDDSSANTPVCVRGNSPVSFEGVSVIHLETRPRVYILIDIRFLLMDSDVLKLLI